MWQSTQCLKWRHWCAIKSLCTGWPRVSDLALTFDFCVTWIKICYLKFNDRIKLFVGDCELCIFKLGRPHKTDWCDQIRPKIHLPHQPDLTQVSTGTSTLQCLHLGTVAFFSKLLKCTLIYLSQCWFSSL